MTSVKTKILNNICYTELVYGRINKKLQSEFTKKEIEDFIPLLIHNTDVKFISRKGKNYYVCNHLEKIRITINSNTFGVITVDRIAKK